MDFAYSAKVEALREQLRAFMDTHVVPRLADWQREVEAGAWPPSMIEPLKRRRPGPRACGTCSCRACARASRARA